MTLTGKAAEELAARLKAEAHRRRADQLAAAKAEAARRGKEPFDLARLEAMVDTTREGRLDPEDTRRARLEELYYTSYPDVMTLAELAAKLAEQNRW